MSLYNYTQSTTSWCCKRGLFMFVHISAIYIPFMIKEPC